MNKNMTKNIASAVKYTIEKCKKSLLNQSISVEVDGKEIGVILGNYTPYKIEITFVSNNNWLPELNNLQEEIINEVTIVINGFKDDSISFSINII